ncbi:MAG: thymidine kinase [Porphyromonas sp.]|nr:thymidine kinase [Porphyromonas sp.]
MYQFEEDSDIRRKKIRRHGSIEVICGSMFSGKTEELIRRVRRATIAQLKVELFKPSIDTRYSKTDIVSHSHESIPCTEVSHSMNVYLLGSDADVVGVDEVQFFDNGIVDACVKLADEGVRVIVSGLDMDFKREPFGPMPGLCAVADSISKVHAVCLGCGRPAQYSHRLVASDQTVLLGETGEYMPLCRSCYLKLNKK